MNTFRELFCGDLRLDLSTPKVMGILNVTPDSFSDGGQFVSVDNAIKQASDMIDAGASIIDVGGESTRPGAQAVNDEEECRRVIPVIDMIRQEYPDVLISVDTSKPKVMEQAIGIGANIINDVNALRAPGALDVVKGSSVAVCLMHMQGEPRTMQDSPQYDDVVIDVMSYLQQRIITCVENGISYERIVIDPGFGFGKTVKHNLTLLRNLHIFADMDVALMVGLSRKSMIGALLEKPVEQRVTGSVALAMLSMWLGAHIIRAHDVSETMDAVKLYTAVKEHV